MAQEMQRSHLPETVLRVCPQPRAVLRDMGRVDEITQPHSGLPFCSS